MNVPTPEALVHVISQIFRPWTHCKLQSGRDSPPHERPPEPEFAARTVARRCYLVANKGNHTMRIVQIKRDMDAAAMAEMKPMFEELADGVEGVCFDLGGVGFLDSSGVGGIVFVFKRLQKRSRQVTLTNVEGQPLRLLRQLRLEFMIERRPTRAA